VLGSFALAQTLRSEVFQVPVTDVAMSALWRTQGGALSGVPPAARRAARLDPQVALRHRVGSAMRTKAHEIWYRLNRYLTRTWVRGGGLHMKKTSV